MPTDILDDAEKERVTCTYAEVINERDFIKFQLIWTFNKQRYILIHIYIHIHKVCWHNNGLLEGISVLGIRFIKIIFRLTNYCF